MRLYILAICALSILTTCTQDQETSPELSELDKTWWKEGIIYQIYPRSFKDTNGDGIGDIRGVIEKLDYIESLGVTMVWMNPFFSSPNADNGYDVSDYRGIMQEFGTMQDFDEMLEGMHQRNIKFVLDVVVNHSSDEHDWFMQSRSSRDNPYRDYYHWWPAEMGEPNYRWSFFDPKGEAWKYDSLTDAYYLHYFAQKQPDLKWENPKVRQEVYDIMKFWADKGVDGFRLDAFQYISKDTTFPALPEGYEEDVIEYYGMGPNLHDYIREMNQEVLRKYDVFAVSEGVGSTFEDAHNLVDADRNELQMAYHFEGVDLVNSLDGYELAKVKDVFSKWDSAFAREGWISIFLSNHDVARVVSRFGNDSPEFRSASAKMLNTFILSMRGTPYTYYGDELGMTNIDFDSIEQYRDIAAINGYQKALADGENMDQYLERLNFLSRDNARTPMQWNDRENAGFTSGTPWLPVNPNYTEINVQAQENDPESCLNHYRKMVELRKNNEVLIYGDYKLQLADHPQIYAFTRALGNQKMLILLNFSSQSADAELPDEMETQGVLLNNYRGLSREGTSIILQPFQAVILNCKS